MKAAEAGSPVGQMYYGLALRLGAGIHRDERRGFNELVHACDRMLAAGALDLRAAAGTVLTPAQLKSMSVGYNHTAPTTTQNAS
jgi:TPR repeat protein